MSSADDTLANIDAVINGYVTTDFAVSDDAMRQAASPVEDPANPELEIIDLRTRADAIRDGSQVEIPADIARDAGIGVPVSLTRSVWDDCVAWDDADAERTGAYQDETGRLWDVVWMGMNAARRARPTDATPIPFQVYRVSRTAVPGPDGVEPEPVYLLIVLGVDFDCSPCITIMQPDED
jgi:uncharacterized protein DUF6573